MYIVRNAHYLVDKNLYVRCDERERRKKKHGAVFFILDISFALNVHRAVGVTRWNYHVEQYFGAVTGTIPTKLESRAIEQIIKKNRKIIII